MRRFHEGGPKPQFLSNPAATVPGARILLPNPSGIANEKNQPIETANVSIDFGRFVCRIRVETRAARGGNRASKNSARSLPVSRITVNGRASAETLPFAQSSLFHFFFFFSSFFTGRRKILPEHAQGGLLQG